MTGKLIFIKILMLFLYFLYFYYIYDYKELVGKRQTRVYYHLESSGKEQLVKDYYQMIDAIQKILEPAIRNSITSSRFLILLTSYT